MRPAYPVLFSKYYWYNLVVPKLFSLAYPLAAHFHKLYSLYQQNVCN